ncbi:MAG: DUF5995 family protein [Acidobacteria bacterium]|nr:DUF5995 family protein [Acidobacteriota bacterium]
MPSAPETIDDVITRLTSIIDDAKTDGSRLGYFPALYRKVTVDVRDGIANGVFDDGARMERLDVVFASRYLDAFEAYRAGGSPTQSWQFAFDVTTQWWPIVLQHLLLGINAHINLDLGIAAARVAPGAQLSALRDDFNKINGILASLVGGVQDELARIWTTLRLLNRYPGHVETAIINFSMEEARDHAWSVAERLAPLPVADQAPAIASLDQEVWELAHVVRYPTVVGTLVTKVVRVGERGTVPGIIDLLS